MAPVRGGGGPRVMFGQGDLACVYTFTQHRFNFVAHRRPVPDRSIDERANAGRTRGMPPLP